jgi:hypothetical protein
VSEHQELDLFSLIEASPGPEDAANEEVDEREQHGSPSIEESACYRRLRDRRIVDSEPFRVPDPGSEASVAVSCFERLAAHVPGTQAIVYDTALRGVHHQKILRELGIVPVNMVAAAETFASKTLKRKIKRREKTVHVEDKDVRLPDGSTVTLRLFSEARAIGLMRPTEAGELEFAPLARKRTHRMKAADSGLYRWYNDYRLPEHIG